MNLIPSHITINNFEIDEDKRKRDTELRKKYEKLDATFSELSWIFTNIFLGLFFLWFLALIIFSQEDAKKIFLLFMILILASSLACLIFDILGNKTNRYLLDTHTEKEYDILENEKNYWDIVKNVLKEETTIISIDPVNEDTKNILSITFLNKNGILNNKRFELSNSQLTFNNIPYEVIDLAIPKFINTKLSNDYITVTLPLHCFPVYTDQICKEN